MGAIEVDESMWPLVVVTFPHGEVTDDSVQRFLENSEQRLQKPGRHALRFQAVTDTQLTIKQRRMMGDHTKAHTQDLRRAIAGVAIVAPSTAMRAIVMAVGWIASPPFPQKTFATVEEADAWLRAQLASG